MRQLEIRQGQAFQESRAEARVWDAQGYQAPRTHSPHLSCHPGPEAKGRGWLAFKILETKGWQMALKGTGSFYESLKFQGLLVMDRP